MLRGKRDERTNQLNRETQAKIAAMTGDRQMALELAKEAAAQKRHSESLASAEKVAGMRAAGKASKGGGKDKSENFYRLINANNGTIQANEREIIELQKELIDMGPATKGVPDPKRDLNIARIAQIRRHNDRIRQQTEELYADSKGIPIAEPPPRPTSTPIPSKGGLSGLSLIGASDLFKTK